MNDEHLEGLSLKLGDSWEPLARRLGFIDADIEGFESSKKNVQRKDTNHVAKLEKKTWLGCNLQGLVGRLVS